MRTAGISFSEESVSVRSSTCARSTLEAPSFLAVNALEIKLQQSYQRASTIYGLLRNSSLKKKKEETHFATRIIQARVTLRIPLFRRVIPSLRAFARCYPGKITRRRAVNNFHISRQSRNNCESATIEIFDSAFLPISRPPSFRGRRIRKDD